MNRIILPENFHINKYGIDCRLVNESDASFILELRTDKKLSKYINSTSDDLSKQIEWIKEYKKRERLGLEYYFIYSSNNKSFGVNRIYNMKDNSCTGGSWICKIGTDVEKSIASNLLGNDIKFEVLNFMYDNFDVRKENLQVQKIHKMFGAKIIGYAEFDILYSLSNDDYCVSRNKIIRLLDLKK